MNGKSIHKPVLLGDSIEQLNIKPDGIYVDLTFGGGGHSMGILNLLDRGRLFSFDKDSDVDMGFIRDRRFEGIKANFIYLTNYMEYYGIKEVDGILLDLGLSSMQIGDNNRGFSYKFDADLDMRVDNNTKLKAYDIINKYDSKKLEYVISNYGDIFNAKKIVSKIVKYRKNNKIKTTFELLEILDEFASRRGKYNQFISKFFQSLRIEVNKEMDNLKILLKQIDSILKIGARFVVISYHSLEDRMVKNFIKRGDLYEGDKVNVNNLSFVGKGIIRASRDEVNNNIRARSAKMRVIEKTYK